jgi:hypothetical protein
MNFHTQPRGAVIYWSALHLPMQRACRSLFCTIANPGAIMPADHGALRKRKSAGSEEDDWRTPNACCQETKEREMMGADVASGPYSLSPVT